MLMLSPLISSLGPKFSPVVSHLARNLARTTCAMSTLRAEDRQLYLVLDFHKVSGIDATAVRSCFLRLKQLVDEWGAIMVMTGWVGGWRRFFLRYHLTCPQRTIRYHAWLLFLASRRQRQCPPPSCTHIFICASSAQSHNESILVGRDMYLLAL